ncbi:kelch repeat-containing protein, partial [Archangium violaceum]|uniref:kelch repeat-containing protein n=1 Tax=Archangium violaceum TaxID=83451 RepID=UPI001F17D8D6
TARSGHTATLLPDGRVLVTGGTHSGTEQSSAEVYDPATGLWSAAGTMAMPRAGHTATLLPDGQVLITGMGSPSTEVYDPVTGEWSPTDSQSQPRTFHTATPLSKGQVLLTGGNGPLASAEVYTAPGVPSPAGELEEARTDLMAVLLPDGQVLVAGGSGTSGPLASTELFNPVTGLWTHAESMQTPRASATATLLQSGEVLVVGGTGLEGSDLRAMSSGPALSSAELFNPLTRKWRSVGSLNQARHSHSALLLPTGKVLVAGGLDAQDTPLNTAELYDPVTRTWRPTRSMSTARQNPMVLLLLSGQVLVAGGEDAQGKTLSTVEQYDPVKERWTEVADMNTARASAIAVLLPEGEVLVAGGTNGSADLSSTEVYDVGTKTWSAVGSMRTARRAHAAHLMPTGGVLVLGGTRGGDPLSDVEVYDPEHEVWRPRSKLITPQQDSTTVLLATGQVLIIGGKDAHGPLSGAQQYAEGQGIPRPVIESLRPQRPGASVPLRGSGFRGTSGSPSMARLLLEPGGALRDLTVSVFSETSARITLPDVPDMPDGHHLLFLLTDGIAGGQMVHVDGTPPGAPVVKAQPARVNQPLPTVTGTAEPGSTVKVLLDDREAGTATANATGAWSLTLTIALEEGIHQLTATATDEAGNTSPPSVARGLTLDREPPLAPEVLPLEAFINVPRPTLGGTAEPGSSVTVFVNDERKGSSTTDTEGRWSHTLTKALKDGKYSVAATATDMAGNVSPPSMASGFTVDTQAPAAPTVLAPQEGDKVSTPIPTLGGTAAPGSKVLVFLDGHKVGTATADDTGAWSLPAPKELTRGEHTVSARAKDAAGNISPASALRRFTVSGANDEEYILSGGGLFGCAAGPGQSSAWVLGLILLRRRPGRRRLA